jgi:CubicO group peptidase (beta-lactamase class C family)
VNGQLVGLPVAGAAAGIAGWATNRPVDGDTLLTVLSATQGIAAICMHLLAGWGKLAYDYPVGVTPKALRDGDGVCAAIAADAPL